MSHIGVRNGRKKKTMSGIGISNERKREIMSRTNVSNGKKNGKTPASKLKVGSINNVCNEMFIYHTSINTKQLINMTNTKKERCTLKTALVKSFWKF